MYRILSKDLYQEKLGLKLGLEITLVPEDQNYYLEIKTSSFEGRFKTKNKIKMILKKLQNELGWEFLIILNYGTFKYLIFYVKL